MTGTRGFVLLIRITVRRGILQPIRLWLIQELIKHLLRVENLSPHIIVIFFQGLDPFLNLLIEARQRLGLQVNRLLALADGERGSINRRDIQKHKVPGTTGVELLNDPEVLVHKLVVEVIKVLVPVAIANVVDADPESEETVGGFPRRERGLSAKDWDEKTLDLVFERENGGHIGRDKVGVDCGTAWNCQLPGTWFWDLFLFFEKNVP